MVGPNTLYFFYQTTLNKHLIHGKELPYCYDVCHDPFSGQNSMKVQHLRCTGECPYPCDKCSKLLRHTKSLKRLHSGECPYACDECKKSFCSKMHLQTHECIHSGEQPYSCGVCNKSFSHQCTVAAVASSSML